MSGFDVKLTTNVLYYIATSGSKRGFWKVAEDLNQFGDNQPDFSQIPSEPDFNEPTTTTPEFPFPYSPFTPTSTTELPEIETEFESGLEPEFETPTEIRPAEPSLPIDWLHAKVQSIPRFNQLLNDLKNPARSSEAWKTLNAEFPDFVRAFNFFRRNNIHIYDPDRMYGIVNDPKLASEARSHFQTLTRYAVAKRIFERAAARGDIDIQKADKSVLAELIKNETSDIVAKVSGTGKLTEQDYREIVNVFRDAGLISGQVPPAEQAAKMPGILSYFASLSPLAKAAVLLGIPLGLIGAYQALNTNSKTGYIMLGVGGLAAALGLSGLLGQTKTQ